jgi:7-carboxy-7-deazaguanine synthase
MDSNIFIHSIYRATEGEGIFVGIPQIFVRFQGCEIHCKNCDSKETWKFIKQATHTIGELCQEIDSLALPVSVINPEITTLNLESQPIKRVSITGGDPLHDTHHKAVISLIDQLKKRGFFTNIEASGNSVDNEIFSNIDFISFDFKTPSTEVITPFENLFTLVNNFKEKFQVKSVIADIDDFNFTYKTFLKLKKELPNSKFPWCLTPAYRPEENFPQERFHTILKLNEECGGPFRVVGQQHKWVYGPDRRNV